MKTFKHLLLALAIIALPGFTQLAHASTYLPPDGGKDPLTEWIDGTSQNEVRFESDTETFSQRSDFMAEIMVTSPTLAGWELKNKAGELVAAGNIELSGQINPLKFKIGNLRKGVYFLTISANGGQATRVLPIQ